LEDESQLVIKAGLQLVFRIIFNQPFGTRLCTPEFVAIHQQYQQKEKDLAPQEDEDPGPQWEEGTVKVG
jgi:hypothetical protein